jgi:cardiolipin synthase
VNILNLYRYILLASHKKILLCDDPNYGLVAMVGGRNIGDEYLCDIPDPQPGRFANQWRDTDEVIYGPATIELEQSFIFSFNEMSAKKFKLNPNDVKYRPEVNTPSKGSDLEMRIVENEPDRNGGKGIFDVNTMYKELFKHAKNSIDIETPYFIPTDDFIKLLLETANRGVKIRVLTNSENTNDVGTPLFLGGAYFWEPLFKTGNFRLYLWDVERSVAAPELFRTMHSKILIVDNAVFMPGSWNFEARSIIWNNEFAFPINDPGMSQKATEMYETDISTPGVYEMTLEKYNAKFTSKDRFLMSLLSKLNMFL